MSGHSKWSKVKHKKGAVDQKRGQLFSKLLRAISVAAKSEQNPEFNPTLRAAVEKAKKHNVPADNIDRAIRKASEVTGTIEELLLEAYGPGGGALIIEAITDNHKRTISEIKHLLVKNGGKWAESGSVAWAFQLTADLPTSTEATAGTRGKWVAKFPQILGGDDARKLATLVEALEEHGDVQHVYTNAQP